MNRGVLRDILNLLPGVVGEVPGGVFFDISTFTRESDR